MKTTLRFCSAALMVCVFIFSSCKKSDTTEDVTTTPTPASFTPAVTAVGTNIGAPVSANVDASGGTLFSADGKLELIIPAGALTTLTAIAIQPTTNECPGGAGLGYSLTPNGQLFNVPVTIRFHYDSAEVVGTDIHMLGAAYQKTDRTWSSFSNAVLDSAASTESINSSHFTGFALFEKMYLSPKLGDTVRVSESTEAFSLRFISIVDDLLAPASLFAYPQNVTWTVNGNLAGTQDDGTASPSANSVTTIYTAPQTTDNMSSNPVSLVAVVHISGSTLNFISSIKVISPLTYTVFVLLEGESIFMTGSTLFIRYLDSASFILNADEFTGLVYGTGFTNYIGHADSTQDNGFCHGYPLDNGNLLDIYDVTGQVIGGQIYVDIFSNFIQPSFNVDCGGGPVTEPSHTWDYEYNMQGILIDGSEHVISQWFNNHWVSIIATPI